MTTTATPANTIAENRKVFLKWYFEKYHKQLPLYTSSCLKKQLVAEFKKDTGKNYLS